MAEIKQGDNPALDYTAMQAESEARTADTALQVHELMDQQADAANMAMIQTLALGTANATVSNQKNALQAATDAKAAAIQVRMGSDSTLQGSLSSQWLDRMNENAQKAYDTLDVIKEKQSKTLLNDPLGFIAAQFTLPADIAQHNYYAEKSNIAEEQLNQITQSSNAQVIAANNAAAKTSTELALAEAQQSSINAQLGVAKILSESAGTRIVGLDKLDSLGKQDMNFALQLHSAKLADAQLAETKKLHEDNMRVRQEAAEKVTEGKANIQATMEEYNAGARRTLKPVFSDLMAFSRYYAKNNSNPEFQSIWGQGQEILAQGGATNGIAVASTSGHAAMIYASGSEQGVKADPVAAFLVRQLSDVKAVPGASKDREVLAAAVTEQATKVAKNQLREIDSRKGSIYAAPPPAVVLSAVGLADDPFMNEIVKPLVEKNPTAPLEDDTMVGLAQAYSKKPGGLDMAADGLSTYYKLAKLKNDLLNQYAEKGLPAMKGQPYNVRINGALVDLSDKIAVKTMLLKQNTRDAIGGDASFFNMMGQPGQ